MLNKRKDSKEILNYFLTLLLIAAVIVSALGLFRDIKNTVEFGGVDLRPKVTGARLLMQGYDPYHYKWSPDDPEILLDPNDSPDVPVSRVTVTPSYLVLHSSIANMPYKTQRLIWLGVQWVLLLLSILLFAKSTISTARSKLIWIIGLMFISGSSFWRLHIERGQIYIIFIFLISLAYFLYDKKFKFSSILSGFLIGYTVSLRPPMIFMALPILIYRQWKLFIGTAAGFILGMASPLIFSGISIWKNYYSSMQYFGTRPDSLGIPWGVPYKVIYPDKIIEGMKNLGTASEIEYYDSSLQAIFLNYLGKMLSPNILSIMLAATVVIIAALLLIIKINNISPGLLFLTGISLVIIGEFFLPAAGYPYANIIWLIPLCLIIIESQPLSSLIRFPIIFLFTGIFLTIAIPFAPGRLLFSWIFMVFYILIQNAVLLKDSWQTQKKNN